MALRYALSDGKRECTGLSGCSAFERGCVKFALETGTSFYAHIAADRCHWQMGPTATNLKLVTAYQGRKFGTQATMINNAMPQNLTGYWMKKGSYSECCLPVMP